MRKLRTCILLLLIISPVISIDSIDKLNLPFVEYGNFKDLPENFLHKVIQDKHDIKLIEHSDSHSRSDSFEYKIYLGKRYRKFSNLTVISANKLIRKLKLHRAAQLLQQKWVPVSKIAYDVGFSNLSYFSKVFKEEFGTLPSEYVERN